MRINNQKSFLEKYAQSQPKCKVSHDADYWMPGMDGCPE
tara:strand:+ start:3166 stop:3282 length:117 start_codon:yes stop_codon:yes gene_type:complete